MSPESAECVVSFLGQGIDAFASCLRRFELDVRQLDSGFFNARTITVDLDGLLLKRRTTSLRYAIKGRLPSGLIFYFPLKPQSIFVDGLLIDPQVQLISTGTRQMLSVVPAAYDHLLVWVEQQELQQLLGVAEAAAFVARATAMDRCRVNPQRKVSLTRKLFELYCGVLYRKQALSPQDCLQLRQQIIALLDDYLRAHPQTQQRMPGGQERLLLRTIALVEAEPARAFSLDELSAEVYASKRAIQYAFEALVGLSPMRYVKLNRLNMIRKELLQLGSRMHLGQLADKYQFSNQGRLVREYTDLFAEAPRDTARRGVSRDYVPAAGVLKVSGVSA